MEGTWPRIPENNYPQAGDNAVRCPICFWHFKLPAVTNGWLPGTEVLMECPRNERGYCGRGLVITSDEWFGNIYVKYDLESAFFSRESVGLAPLS